ncbi:MAG: nucleotidyltransferase family protein [Pseudomonadota bacterium]
MADRAPITGVLLAAGQAKRMAGASKVLAVFDGLPLVRRQAERLLASRCSEIIVVTGHQSERVRDALTGLSLTIVLNERFESGMGSSISAAAQAVQDNAILLTFADMPGLTTDHFDQVLSAWDGEGILRGANRDIPGHPILFPPRHIPHLRSLSGDQGAKMLARGAALLDIGPAALFDVDTPEAVAQAGGQPA